MQNNKDIYKNYNLTEEQKKDLDGKWWMPSFIKEIAAYLHSQNNKVKAQKNTFSEAEKAKIKAIQGILITVENFYHEPPIPSPTPIGNVAGKAEKGSSKIVLDNLDIEIDTK